MSWDAERPRVLHVISGIDVGGAERHLLSLCKGLVDRGFDVTVAYCKGDGELAEAFIAAGCSVFEIGIRADADPLGFAKLLAHVRRHHYDIVHTHLIHGDIYGTTAAKLAGVPTIVASKHNDPPFWQTQPYRTLHNWTVAATDGIIAISDHVRNYVLEQTPADPATTETIHYGMELSEFWSVDDATVTQTRAEFVEGDGPLVGTVARLTTQKDLGMLLRTFATVRDRQIDAHLAIVGRGEQEAELKCLAADLGVDDACTFTGFRQDIPALMNAFDVFALSSRWEGFGVVFLEAMAAGTPVVASDTSAIPEVVADGETGLLCDPGNTEAFAAALATLLTDDQRRVEIGEAAQRRAETKFGVDQMIEATIAFYARTKGNKTR
jgi:glycosyltransferase involved in cell wall biosynthesis